MPVTAPDGSAFIVVGTINLQKIVSQDVRLMIVGANPAAGLEALVTAGPIQDLGSLPQDLFSVFLALGFAHGFKGGQDPVAVSDGPNAHVLQLGICQSEGDSSVDLVFLEHLGVVLQFFFLRQILGDLPGGPLRKILVHNVIS